MERYYVISCHVLWREFCYLASISNNVYNFTFLQQGLHNTPDLLRKDLQQAIDHVGEEYSAILLGYGLCCNGLKGITARDKKLVVIRAHDCITFLLGSKERYQVYFDSHPGTYWYSPGWIETNSQPSQERYEQTLQNYMTRFGQDNAEYLMEMEQGWFKKYSYATYVDLGFGDMSAYKAYTQKCAEWLDWTYHEVAGNPRLMSNLLMGNWNSEEFLIVAPGETIDVSYDKNILKIQEPPARV